MRKRVLSLALTVLLALSLLPATAFAASSDFVIENGVLTGYNGSGGDVTIPNSVTCIGQSAFQDCSSLTSVTIPNSVTGIEGYAFDGCTSLTSITIPDSVTDIGWSAFRDCSSLTSVTIPNSVTSIKYGAFKGCTGLTSVTIPNSVTYIDSCAFWRCSSLTSVTIPNSVTYIGGDVFRECTSLTSITIPNSVTSIGDSTFEGCTGLTSVTIPNSVASIGWIAFFGCTSLTDVYYGGSEAQWKAIHIDNSHRGNDALNNANIHYNSTMPFTLQPPAVPTAYASTQNVLVDGKSVEFQCYALKDENGYDTNYIKLRDVAFVLNGTAAQFNVGWNGAVNIETGKAYVSNGSEMSTPFSGNRTYEKAASATKINGEKADLDAILLKDDTGAGYTYYKLRDLGSALGFKVDWSAQKGIFIETK